MSRITIFLLAAFIIVAQYPLSSFALSEVDYQSFGTKYGVSPQLLRAIAITESREGKLLGIHLVKDVASGVQLKYLKKIAEYTDRALSEFIGSRAGAMGYMQIIPSTFHYYAQDGDGDGIKDPLNDYDSLATAAYFLAVRIAKREELYRAIRDYNNSTTYCRHVLSLYIKLEAETKFAGLLKYFQSRSP